MFVGDEISVPVGTDVAAARLADLIGTGSLDTVSRSAWSEGVARIGPAGPVLGISKLVRIQFSTPVRHGGTTAMALRWEAIGVGGALFPVLDADITLVPDGEQATLIGLDGVYRPPGGALGAALDKAVMHRIATATIRALLAQIGRAIAGEDADIRAQDQRPERSGPSALHRDRPP